MIPKIRPTQQPLMRLTGVLLGLCGTLFMICSSVSANWQTPTMAEYSKVPPFVTSSAPPLVMLVMGRDHKFYYEAYNDASDLNEDGVLDTVYKPDEIDYYGYFDSYKYYSYNSANERFEPAGVASDKKAPIGDYWSGDFLNYLTMSRIDTMRKVLYGGYRSVDTDTETVLERAYIPNDAHCWGKEYNSPTVDGYLISDYAPYPEPGPGRRHLFANGSLVAPGDPDYAPLLRVRLNSNNRIWTWVTAESKNNILGDTLVGVPDDDFEVRVQVGVTALPDLRSERVYGSGASQVYKPIGLLQRYGESNSMFFGLLSGSYDNHLSGGVLRKNISSINDEINPNTGEFLYQDDSTIDGIIKTIDNFRIIGFDHGSNYWDYTTYAAPITEGQNYMWGNPLSEMMYETLRYFAGETSTSAFTSGVSDGNDRGLDLPLESWDDPYATYPNCAKPFMLVISDINPSYDTDQVPGSAFGGSGSFMSFNAADEADAISAGEGLGAFSHYVGDNNSIDDKSCSPKSVTSLAQVRGLCPEEPTRLGGYYAASVAHYGVKTDINSASEDQKVSTFAVGLASPLPKVTIELDSGDVTLVPFAKTVVASGGGGVTPARGDFQPTCAIVDFYVDTITPTSGLFRVTYEHAEQGSDYDMDALITYEYTVTSSNTLDITISSMESTPGGSSRQHFGYIISGTTADGVYLEIKNNTQSDGGDQNYYLDTPSGCGPNTGTADTCWDTGTNLPNLATRSFTGSGTPAATLLENPLYYAAKWGGFEDLNNSGTPDQPQEWDDDGNGVPDSYFYVTNPLRLQQQLGRSFDRILARGSSGTAASVISNSRSGEGAIYQSIFYPSLKVSPHTVEWVGQVHALLVDANGNLREDSNNNQILDVADDKFIVFDGGTVYRHTDTDADSVLDASEAAIKSDVVYISDLNFLWSSSDWLNDNSLDPVNQRSYGATTHRRHIFTFVDDGDMVAGTNEQMDFVAPSEPTWTQMIDPTNFFAYLHTHPPYNPPISIGDSDFEDMVTHQAKRIVDFIRGQDQGADTVGSTPLPAFRPRQIDYNNDATVETWRMGDIVQSTPKLVGQPFEKYDLIYRDTEYNEFFKLYRYRRNMIYVGANDGMLHAFNGGFFSVSENKFALQPKDMSGNPVTTGGTNGLGGIGGTFHNWDLGSEVWAYVPFNLLPHLYWLTDTNYSHVYYNDLEPKIFDAKIFPDDPVHPNGWGTVLVGGMRFGGGKIAADIDKSDSTGYLSTDKAMSSAFYILDITNPEIEPKVMAEITFPDLGYTTCFPAVVPIRKKHPTTGVLQDNQWYLMFGSGPTGVDGPDYVSAQTGVSTQEAVMYAIDLVKLGTNKELWTVDSTGNPKKYDATDAGPYYLTKFTGDSKSSVTEPIAVDWTLDYSTDAVYFGESFGDHTAGIGWNGKLRRIVLQKDDDSNPDPPWVVDSTLIDLSATTLGGLASNPVSNGQPIMAAATAGLDSKDQRWIFFGTGRYYSKQDGANSDQQSYYGIKEPYTGSMGSYDFTYDPVSRDDLLDVTGAVVNLSGTVDLNATTMSFDALKTTVDSEQGWVMDLVHPAFKERNLGQAVLAGDLLTFTSYEPSTDPCTSEGQTQLYALYYLTGTAYFKSTIGVDISGNVLDRVSLGKGLSLTPNIHVGSKAGSTAYIQTSTGAIESLEQANPGRVKSGKQYWNMNDSACP